jgi:hypothetical protein
LKTLRFAIQIDSPRQVVWAAMIEPETYKDWTAEFGVGSYFEGSWEKGERIRFLTPDGTGMTSIIDEHRPHDFISIRHLGFIKDGIEDTESEEVRRWAPSFENYTFTDVGSSTEINVALDVPPEWEDDMLQMWPKALVRLKTICESLTRGK